MPTAPLESDRKHDAPRGTERRAGRALWGAMLAILVGLAAFSAADVGSGSEAALRTQPFPEFPLRIGDHRFTAGDIDVRRRIILQKYEDPDRARLGAYAQLIEGFLLVEVLAEEGRPITEADLDAETARIDRDTRDAERLRRLKEMCGDPQAYRRIGILPDFANRRFFYEVHPQPDAHEIFWERAGNIPVRVVDPAVRGLLKTKVSWAAKVRWEER